MTTPVPLHVVRPQEATVSDAPPATPATMRLAAFLRNHHYSVINQTFLILLGLLSSIVNLAGFPARFVDEGTYVQEAWAIWHDSELAHYTYWYDHPPLGWIQMWLWSVITGGFQRYELNTMLAGREFMVVLHVASIVLLYCLARRLGLRRSFALVAGLLYILSPLVSIYARFVLLDNVSVPWALAAFLLALSPRRNLMAFVGSALCLIVAVLSKETTLLIAPAWIYAMAQNTRHAPNRPVARLLTLSTFGLGVSVYPVFAFLKWELLPGPGHVSLWDAVLWQLHGRASNGSVFDPTSDSRTLVNIWIGLDRWLFFGGMVAMVIVLARRQLRPIALALFIQLAMMVKTSYVPYPYIIGLLPFAALLMAAAADMMVPRRTWLTRNPWWKGSLVTMVGLGAIIAPLVVFALYGTTDWQYNTNRLYTADADAPNRAALDWTAAHVPTNARVVTESKFWLDLRNRGYVQPEILPVDKIDSDPAVAASLGGDQHVDYIVISRVVLQSKDSLSYPTLMKVAANSDILASYGDGDNQVLIMRQRGAHPAPH